MPQRLTIKKDLHNESYFDRQERISWWSQEKISSAKVMVVGAGAIGNETIKNLVLLGFQNILICDFDTISPSNLSRTVLFRTEDVGKLKSQVAAERASSIALASEPNITWFHGDVVWELGLGVFRSADVVLGCLDNVEARMAINRACRLVGRPWIDAGIAELAWSVSVFGTDGPCYECTLTDQQLANRRRRYSCDNVKKSAFSEGKVPTVQISASLAAAIQVQEACKLICQLPASIGRKIYCQGLHNDFDVLILQPNPRCLIHTTMPEVIPIGVSAANRLDEVLKSLRETFGSETTIDLSAERSFVRSAACRKCSAPMLLNRPLHRLTDLDLICHTDPIHGGSSELDENQPTSMDLISRFSRDAVPPALLDYKLSDLGIPSRHILPVIDGRGHYKYVQLANEQPSSTISQ